MALTTGSRLGVYEVTAPIGEGGMGAVYRATDTSLGRQVAIKVLPDAFAQDAERLARFDREARTLAALNHPHIAAIYGVERSGSTQALVMELVEGEDLSERIARDALPVDEALPIAKQIAEALEAAHEQGIIHRDLKPANIKVRPDGTVKVLDFGLAKLASPAEAGHYAQSNLSLSPTITSPAMMTGAGIILGTAAYMAPEQARGRAVDKRADIWAFGAVVFEMLTGRRAFEGEDVSDTLAVVMRGEPAWDALPAGLPPALVTFLKRCLQKNPAERVRDIGDVRLALAGAFDTTDPRAAGADASAPRERVLWMAALMATLVAGLALAVPAVRHLGETPPPETRVDIVAPGTDDPNSFALSPDGRQIVFLALQDGASRLWLRSLSSTTATPLAGTEGATYPFWSPDSRAVAFFADGKLKRLDLGGGTPQILASASAGRGGAWNADGLILFAAHSLTGLSRVAASGGTAVEITKTDQQASGHRFPSFLPDGRRFLFYVQGQPEVAGIYLGSLDAADTTRLTASDTAGVFAPSGTSGWLLWVRGGSLVAQALDLEAKALTGEPVTVADSVYFEIGLQLAAVSTSAGGLVAYRSGSATLRQLTWLDRSGKAVGVAGAPDTQFLNAPELSPDGRRIAVDRTVQGNRDVWLLDPAREGLTRFTFDPLVDGYPVWSPDGSRIAFESRRKGKGAFDIWVKPSSGAGAEELLFEGPNNEWPLDWSRDGGFLLYFSTDPNTGADLWALPMSGADRKPVAIANTPFEESKGQFSPDGRWVAYETSESGRFEVVVQTFPVPTGKWQVSTSGGAQPRWRPDGKELYFLSPDRTLMAVAVSASGTAFEAGKPEALFRTRIQSAGSSGPTGKVQYAVSRDGRFLVNQMIDESSSTPITLVQHWNPEGQK